MNNVGETATCSAFYKTEWVSTSVDSSKTIYGKETESRYLYLLMLHERG